MKLRTKTLATLSITACILAGSMSANISVSAQQSSVASAANQNATRPSTPGNFRIISRNGNKLSLNWEWVSGGVGTIHYELAYGGRTLVLNQYYPGYTLDVSDLDLSPNHNYTFSLWAVDEVGSRSSEPARLTFETTPPTRPNNLIQLSTQQGYPDLIEFQLSSDNTGTIKHYEVFLDGRSFGIIYGIDNQFSLFRQVAEAYLPISTGPTEVQLRAFDSSYNASQLSDPLTVIFP